VSRKKNVEVGLDLPTVNRFAVVLEPAAGYLEWARGCPDTPPELMLQEAVSEGTVYLIPETDAEPEAWLRRHYAPLFAHELFAWCTDEACWPRDRSFKTFNKFFRVRFCSLVLDLGRGPIERDGA
jgi:hypothetical protein